MSVLADARAALLRWCLHEALDLGDIGALSRAFVGQLHALGVPIRRLNLTFRTLHPLFVAENWIWRQDREELEFNRFRWASRSSPNFLLSPLKPIILGEQKRVRHSIRPGPEQPFPLFHEYAALGMTDYLALGLGPAPFPVSVSAMTDQPGGFDAAQLAALEEGLTALRAPLELYVQRSVALSVCSIYLGPQTGPRVLDGAILRGNVTELPAVVWFCDLRGFTPLTQRLGHQAIVDLLNTFFGAVGEAVEAHGGEILKFIGDAALAVFPLGEGRSAERACADALAASRALLDRLGQLDPPLRAAIALHVGEAAYGNIGAETRLDFTVVGTAVNLAARLGGLAAALDEPLLASAEFAAHSPERLHPLGGHALKGFDGEQQVFGLPRGA